MAGWTAQGADRAGAPGRTPCAPTKRAARRGRFPGLRGREVWASGGIPSTFHATTVVYRKPGTSGVHSRATAMPAGARCTASLLGPRFRRVATPWAPDAAEAVLDLLGRHDDGRSELWVADQAIQVMYRAK